MTLDLSTLRLPEEAELHEHLQAIFNAPVVSQLLDIMDARDGDRLQSRLIQENLLPVSERLSPAIYRACQDAVGALRYQGKGVQFLISNSPDVNASSILTPGHVERHYVVLNAGLVNLLAPDELRFVVGHELAHLIFQHSRFSRVMHQVYPDFEQVPPYLQRRYTVWTKLNEMGSDRLGLLAAPSLDCAVRAMLRISGGVNPGHFSQGLEPYYELVERIVTDLARDGGASEQSHPGTPLRVKALQIFDASETAKALRRGDPPPEDAELARKVAEVTQILKYRPSTDREQAILDFLGSAGLLLAKADGEVDEREVGHLVNLLSRHFFHPKAFLRQLDEERDLQKVLAESSSFLVEHYSEEVRGLMARLLPIILRDGRLSDQEVRVFLGIATDQLKLAGPEAIEMLLQGLRRTFEPIA